MSELRKMKGWLYGHPQQRKTKKGIMKFITNWLSREQDKAKPSTTQTYSKPKKDDYDINRDFSQSELDNLFTSIDDLD